ncbi:hypothetical protein FRB93_005676 [Tulasnella sp. JGI-2019a]|nr:hypothetical protein FRB93_005676 [Tulasnella sp. JGI-2019a]
MGCVNSSYSPQHNHRQLTLVPPNMATLPILDQPVYSDPLELPISMESIRLTDTSEELSGPALVVHQATLDTAGTPHSQEPEGSSTVRFTATNQLSPSRSRLVENDSSPTCGPLAKEIEGKIVRGINHHIGAYADVYRGTWTPPGGPTRSVAIKYLRAVKMSTQYSKDPKGTADCLDKRLRREVWTWEKLEHPNVTPLLGYRSGVEPLLLTPYYENGSLAKYLDNHLEAPKLELLVQAANGLLYLHTRNPVVVHGDIKPDNVLVKDCGQAALWDFGLARILQTRRTGLTTSGIGQGGLGFVAPEIMAEDGHKDSKTTKSDVYAVGGLILNVLSGQLPFHHLGPLRIMQLASQGEIPPQNKHPEIDPNATIWDLMERCWKLKPKDRPDMHQVCRELEEEETFFSTEVE